MPVWHKATKKWVADGRLVVLGITQEQHPQRCRLFAQWQEFDWPILHDPLNRIESLAVPIIVAIDEHGIVRDTRPKIETFEATFLKKNFSADKSTPSQKPRPAQQPNLATLRQTAKQKPSAENYKNLGDALVLWSQAGRIDEAIDAYSRAIQLAPTDGNAQFRLGVCFRIRYESTLRQPTDFQTAVDHWSRALSIAPNRYIWRRRIQQYGPRLQKPYPFYDWVDKATREIRARGEEPVKLRVMPTGAEIAKPSRRFESNRQAVESPDPQGRIHRDVKGLIETDVAVVPPRVKPGKSARVHLTLRPGRNGHAHWNNESSPLRLWIDAPKNWQFEKQLITAKPGTKPETTEARHLEFELKIPANATGKTTLKAYALYYVCEDVGGKCLFLRQDIPIVIRVRE